MVIKMNILCSVKELSGSRPRLSNEKNRLRQYFLCYTALFVLTSCIVFCWYFLTERTFIWSSDGWTQHYKALVYYAKYMRSIVRELLYHHRFVLPEWEFAFGEGNDIFQTLHYYVIGDPFAVFSVLVPTRFLWVYYDFMILLRLYLSGAAFSSLCFYTQKNIGRYAVMAGALSYVFCYWAIYNTNRHPFFLNPMLYFPLIILGIEKLLRERKPCVLVVSVFFSAVSNFYYFYVIVCMTAAYATVRLVAEYKTDFKTMAGPFFRISGWSALGTAMGGVILLPAAFTFLGDARMSSGHAWHLVYPPSYYSRLLGTFFSVSGSYWLCMGYAAPVILAVFLLFMRRGRHHVLKTCFLVCLVIILVPALGQFLNGMSYMSNKWCWAFALLCAYILTAMWPELMELTPGDARKLMIVLSVCFLGLLMLEYSRTMAAFAGIGFAFIFLLVIFPTPTEDAQRAAHWNNQKQAIALALVILSVANVSFFRNASATGNYAAEAMEVADVEKKLMATEAKAVGSIAASEEVSEFYRYSGRSLTKNAGLLPGLSNTQYFWSVSNPAVDLFRRAMELPEPRAFNYEGYDDRAALTALSSVKYYVVPKKDEAPAPYGFTYLENTAGSGYKVYRNDYALPLAYTYDKAISEDRWNRLSAVEKQEAMLQAVLLAGYNGETQDGAVSCSSQSLDYSIECNSTGVTLEDYGFVVTKANSSVTISFEGIGNSETYFAINGLDFDGASDYKLRFGNEKYDLLNLFFFWTEPTSTSLKLNASSGVSKEITYLTENYSFYNDRHDFTINLDYSEEAVTSITLTFSKVGVYSFDSLEVVCQPMDRYAEQAAALKETVLKNVEIGTDTIQGNISLDEPRILCFSVPYSAGWTAYVDGEKTTLYQANIKNMAVVLDAGSHDVKLVYHTPYLRAGAVLSVISFAGFIALMCIDVRKRRRSAENRGDLL